MIFAPLVLSLVAVLNTPPPSLSASGTAVPSPASLPPSASEAPVLRDIAPPLDVFPYPPWMVAMVAALALVLVGLMIWALVRWLQKRPPPPPPNPRVVAVRELERLRLRAMETEPYAFSFEVSDVLRTFVSKDRFRLPATQQTSPEFLAAISGSPMFSEQDRTLLAAFLEKCDMIKFARVDATGGDNVALVESALAFVRGGTPA